MRLCVSQQGRCVQFVVSLRFMVGLGWSVVLESLCGQFRGQLVGDRATVCYSSYLLV